MEGPGLTLGLLAILAVCGKSRHHPTLKGPQDSHQGPYCMVPSYPTYLVLPPLTWGPTSHPHCYFSLEG